MPLCCWKRKTGSNLECGDNDNTPSLADDELVDDALRQTNQLRNNKCDVCHDKRTKQMTITHEKKHEVSLLRGPSPSAFVSLEDNVLNKEAKPSGQVVM